MEILSFKELDSTNSYLKENYNSLNNFTFVVAEHQTNGKGRENRKWISNKNENLLFSMLIKDKKILNNFQFLSMGSATLIGRFLELNGIKNVAIKWPNDVYVNDKKICGILLEGSLPDYLVVGIGLNVNQTIFEGEYRITPTSMKNEIGKSFDLSKLQNELFTFLSKHLIQNQFIKKTKEFLNSHNYLLGKTIEINGTKGLFEGFDENLNVIIKGKSFSSGEIKN